MNQATKPSPYSFTLPVFLCSVSGVSVSDIKEGWRMEANDPNFTQVQALYTKSGLQYPTEFICFMAVVGPFPSSYVEAYGAKAKAIERISEVPTNYVSKVKIPQDMTGIFSSGVVLLAKPGLINEIAVAAPGDISQIAAEKKNITMSNILDLVDEYKRRAQIQALIQQANKVYCEVRLHRKLCYSDIAIVYSLGEFHQYLTR